MADHIAELPDPQAGIDLLRRGHAQSIVEEADRIFSALGKIGVEAAEVAAEIALAGTDPDDATSALHHIAGRIEDVRDAATRPDGLVDRARLLRAIAALEARGLGELTAWVQTGDGREHRAALPDIVSAIYDRSLTDHIQDRFGRTLDAYDGSDLDRLRSDIAKADLELTDLARAAIREELIENSNPPQGNGTGKVGTYTNMSLIHHETNKVRNRIGVRDLTSRAGSALINLKPCWMMSPLAVAQYLHGRFAFDLLVIDEASQMTPENALGAIMRAKQVVVVGDTKQLPPTNFFSKVLDDHDDDEDSRTDAESILDMANTTFTPVRQLRWHYRSRHPALIAVSNKMVYENQLTIFPAARDGDPDLGVELFEVEGEYRKGRNIPEAHAIVAGAIQHMRDHPERSLGLATMNKDQTELILAEFERERARHPHVEAYIERWTEKDDGLEEFFVKNLETIQGDERDVIMISTLYGPDAESGKVYQRFGPVNSVHGHRRLNVLFSRAKEKIVTYSSMKPTDIQAENKAYGVAMLRSWLEFSRTGRITEIQTERPETDSPFEDFVIAQIEAAGYEAVPQVGEAGYRIDIGVRHPSWPYGFILGVECDGAPYHSSRSSRDRDRLRQQVLEGLGWRFHRIWSTDWFRNSRSQIERLRQALDAALVRAKEDEARRQEERARAAERARQATEEAIERAAAAEAEAVAMTNEASPLVQMIKAKTSDHGEARGETQGLLFEEEDPQEHRFETDADSNASERPSSHEIGGKKPSLSDLASARIEEWDEDRAYDAFNRTTTTRKRGFYWLGFLEGVAASNAIEDGEAEALVNEAREMDAFFGADAEVSISDGLGYALELSGGDVMAAIEFHAEAVRDDLDDPDLASDKDAVNTFLGFCAGIVCDGRITSEEARKIHARFHADSRLAEAPMFAQLRWAVDGALADAVLDDDEAEEIREWLAALVTDGHADTGVANIGGVVAPTDPITDPAEVDLEGKTFVLTGKMSMGPRSLIGQELARRGAALKGSVTDKTDFVVVSNTASLHWTATHYGTKIEAARKKIDDGHPMRFVAEHALAQALSRGHD
ncbi:AAA domain-containing protein [Roseivivax marinus]|uniref:AAA domain-containing protein n=1 Tax=Roseivivax marinus TaxID=1379903 RepID=UPI0008B217D2|nr:AAA domain-containing protein [Roseivivax marinus]SEL62839.1 AAA domain-containing protein [Roseivivax marinus]